MAAFPWHVVSVRALDGYRLDLVFADGTRGVYDMSPYLGEGVYARLQNAGLFRCAHVEYDTVVWPGNIDIAPETLYEGCVPAA